MIADNNNAANKSKNTAAYRGSVVCGLIGQGTEMMSRAPLLNSTGSSYSASPAVTTPGGGQARALELVMMTPGVSMPDINTPAQPKVPAAESAATTGSGAPTPSGVSGDKLGQQYVTVRSAVMARNADVIIVGRGIIKYLHRPKPSKDTPATATAADVPNTNAGSGTDRTDASSSTATDAAATTGAAAVAAAEGEVVGSEGEWGKDAVAAAAARYRDEAWQAYLDRIAGEEI